MSGVFYDKFVTLFSVPDPVFIGDSFKGACYNTGDCLVKHYIIRRNIIFLSACIDDYYSKDFILHNYRNKQRIFNFWAYPGI